MRFTSNMSVGNDCNSYDMVNRNSSILSAAAAVAVAAAAINPYSNFHSQTSLHQQLTCQSQVLVPNTQMNSYANNGNIFTQSNPSSHFSID